MTKSQSFIRTSLLGGLIVLLPIAILVFAFNWLFNLIRRIINPLTQWVMERGQFQEFIATLIALGLVVGICFVVGVFVRTQVGRFIHEQVEKRLFRVAPGYNLVKETVMQFLGNRKSPFGAVAMVRLFGTPTLMTAFITDEHENGWCTVFVPTGPNPTSGLIYHLPGENVFRVEHPVEDVMRSIISCGAGTSTILNKCVQANAKACPTVLPSTAPCCEPPDSTDNRSE
jgi:uncharacterized membrane protein